MDERFNSDLKVGDKFISKEGLKYTVVDIQRYCDNVIIQFEDGVIKTKLRGKNVILGNVHHPKIRNQGPNKYKHRIGETIISKYGEKLEITGYKGCNDCTVKFEDGSTKEHVKYRAFKRGTLMSKQYYKQRYIGLKSISKIGLAMTVVGYRTSRDIDVEFENGIVVYNKSLESFMRGNIKCPADSFSNTNLIKKRNKYVGQKMVNTQGIEMTIKKCNGYTDINVEFKDGTLKEHTSCDSFKKG